MKKTVNNTPGQRVDSRPKSHQWWKKNKDRGVRQGDPLSPNLFTAVMGEVFKKADISEGANVDGENLTNLRFADDVALFNDTTKQIEKPLKQSELRKSENWLKNTQRKDKVHDKPCRQWRSTNLLILSYLSRSLADRWGTAVDFTTSFLHSSRFSAFRSVMFHGRPVHSLMLSSHRFLCLPLRLPPWTVPCRIVLVSPDDRVTCPYHFSLRLFTVVKRSSYDPMAFPILEFTSSLEYGHGQGTHQSDLGADGDVLVVPDDF